MTTATSEWPAAPRSDDERLPAGFYQLTLVACFLTTLELRPGRLPGMPSFTILEILLYPVALCLAAELAVRPRLRDRLRSLHRRNRAIAWYAGYAGVASLLGLSRTSETLQVFKDLIPALMLYALLYLTVDSRARLVGALVAHLASALLTVALGLSQIATGGPYLVERSENIEAKLDLAGNTVDQIVTGAFAHPNGLAIGLLPAALFLVVATWPGFGPRRRLSLAMAGALGSVLLVLQAAFVKGVYAWLAAGLVLLALPRRLDRWRFAASIAAVVIGVVGLTWLSIEAFLEGEGVFGTILTRIELWLAGIEVLRADGYVAILGSGAGQIENQPLLTIEYDNAHNAWLNQALTYGLPALGFYLASFWIALRSLGRAIAASSGPRRAVALATMATLMALLGEYFFEPTDRGTVFQAQLFSLFALAAICRQPARPAMTGASEAP